MSRQIWVFDNPDHSVDPFVMLFGIDLSLLRLCYASYSILA